MKKIMFNDKYGLTQAVLGGRKTMTRRIVRHPEEMEVNGHKYIQTEKCRFKVGEVVAVAQSYDTILKEHRGQEHIGIWANVIANRNAGCAGDSNKMFVRADLMPHQIRITNVRVERLQDISEEDCLREGVCRKIDAHKNPTRFCGFKGTQRLWFSPRDAFAALIDKVSGKGTWDHNPLVFVYSFELVK